MPQVIELIRHSQPLQLSIVTITFISAITTVNELLSC